MKACLTVLAAAAWLVSAGLWLWAARQPSPQFPPLTADADVGWTAGYDEAHRVAARRNMRAAVWAGIAALFQFASAIAP